MTMKITSRKNLGRGCAKQVRFAIVCLALMVSGMAAYAQKAVTGKVTDGSDGSGLPGVSVSVKGTTTGSVTDATGSYKVNVASDDAVLAFSFIGYVSQEVAVGNRSSIDIALAADLQSLQEVVVIGYGEAKRKDVTGSITQVTAKEFNSGVNQNPLQSIQGKVAGLTITQGSGDPNASPTVRLRGYTSLAGGSDPLYVVDGVIGVPINSISPNDIETMDVLKDASASAIYGSRAANGVIMITTKRGKSGKPSVTFNNYVAVEEISNRLDLLDGDGYRREVGRLKGPASLNDLQRFPKDANGNSYNTDWQSEIFRTGYSYNNNLGISGGGSNFNYRGSLDFINRDGILANTGLKRTTGRINIDQKALNDKLSIQYNLSFANTASKLADWGIIGSAITFLPTIPVRNEKGEYAEIAGSFDLNNPVAMLENQKFDEVKRITVGGINMKYEILNGLTLGVNGAYRDENNVQSRFRNGAIKAYQGTNGEASRGLQQSKDKLLELTSSYSTQLGSIGNFNVLGGYSFQEVDFDGFGARNTQFLTDQVGYNNLGLGAGSLLTPSTGYTSSYRGRTRLVSFFGRATANFYDKYNFTATLRRDGSSKFGKNNKWGVFPSVAAGWIISNESFLEGNTALSFLKLRAGWGRTGNSEGIGAYNSIRLVGPIGTYYDGRVGDFLPSYGFTQNDNPNLKWEVIEQTNIGLDFQLFGGRLNGTLEVYNKDTKDALYPYQVEADGSRFVTNTILANIGTIRNRGIELALGGDLVKTDDFAWNSRIVGSYYKNTIVSLDGEFIAGEVRFNPFGGRGLSNVWASTLRPGRPLGEFYIPRFSGFSPTDGKVLMEAKDGKEPVSEYDKALLSEAGNPQPFLTGALINAFRYKNLDLSFQLRGIFGHSILNNLRSNLLIPGSVLETNMLNGLDQLPDNYSANQLSDYWLEKATFVRLDNWQIGYQIPVANKLVTNARVYVGGNNLFIITKYKGVDPELEVKGDLQGGGTSQVPNSIGLDAGGIYPKTRTFQLGFNLTF